MITFFRRRQILLRKFVSTGELSRESELGGVVKDHTAAAAKSRQARPDFGHRTLPNHYISDHQLIADMNGKAVLAPASVPSSAANTLIIGGVPFHILEHSKTADGGVRYKLPAAGLPAAGAMPSRSVIYPVYETIDSDYSELSSVYSDTRDTSASTVYTDMSSGLQYVLAGSVCAPPPMQAVRPLPIPAAADNPARFSDSSLLHLNRSLPSAASSTLPPLQSTVAAQSTSASVSSGNQSRNTSGVSISQRQQPFLRNLPGTAVLRSESLRAAATRGPLPLPPARLLQSTISLETAPAAGKPITNL